MALLVTTLLGECKAGRNALEEYVSSVKGGREVSANVAGSEASDLTTLFRDSERVNVDNFHTQAGTSCYWVTMKYTAGETSLVFLLRDRDSGKEAVGASIKRDCTCPDPDTDQPCYLRGATGG
jgi:hypothetical protein